MEDIKRLKQEEEREFTNYISNPISDNPSLFKAKGKFIEQCILLGASAEYLLKTVLLKHGFMINEIRGKKRFDQQLIDRIQRYNRNPQNQRELDELFEVASQNLGQPTNRTINFNKCIEMFKHDIVSNERTYFSGIPDEEYNVTNPETKEFYGDVINCSNALNKIKDLRNNYVHSAETRYEERGIFKFLFNFLIFIIKKEFPNETAELQFLT